MFKGGLTKQEVERMRESAKVAAKRKQPTSKQTTSKETTAGVIDESTIKPIVLAVMKPEISKIDASIASIIRSAEAQQQATVLGPLDAMLVAFKQEIMASIVKSPLEYSTPPRSAQRCPLSDARSNKHKSLTHSSGHQEGETQQQTSLSATSITKHENDPLAHSFSLGLTHDELGRPTDAVADVLVNADVDNDENGEGGPLCRKSKRLRTVPPALVNDYHCSYAILNRAWEAQMCADNRYVNAVLREKYTKLTTLITRPWTSGIADKNRLLPAKVLLIKIKYASKMLASRKGNLIFLVMDILMHLVRSTFNKHVQAKSDKTAEFFDTRFVTMFTRNYPKFKKAKIKKDYAFSKGLADCLKKTGSEDSNTTSFYFPFLIANKHWIGICVDCPSCKIYVLDCNPVVRTDALLSRDLYPVAEMFLLLLKYCGRIDRVDGQNLSLTLPPGDSGFTAALLMQTHALFGPDTFRCVTPLVLTEESQRAAVMLNEFHQIL
ncbi:LOW QUALITY PROTEIN: hypothetical protein HID58_044418 [Brassica napus]|uniref:Ubiquitin-like protease family profile domain-containing protein n=1 Tax=Brassica napus TaxID=3708 RepID=A0ABQ8BKZ5_BRANA|nr:LOW QUALITY PROTEIN: hypothetical protein HID58_044418 [Brassica napus]